MEDLRQMQDGAREPGTQTAETLPSGEAEARAFAAFIAAIKAVGFYPEGNPVRERMIDTLGQHLQACGQGAEGMWIALRSGDVHLNGQPVLTREGEDWETMVRLFESGLRNLTFLPGVGRGELQALLSLLARTVRGELNPTDEDLSVLLWEMDLPAVAYRVVDSPEDLMPITLGDASEAHQAAQEDPTIWEGIHPLERYLASAGGLEETDLDARSLRAEEEEIARLQKLAKQERRHERAKLLMVLAEILLLDLTAAEFERVIGLLRGYALDLLQQGRFGVYMRVTRRLREQLTEIGVERRDAVAKMIDELAGVEAARRAFSALESGRCDDEQGAVAFLSGLAPRGIAVLLNAAATGLGASAAGADDADGVAIRALTRTAAQRPEVLLTESESLKEEHLRLLARILPHPVPPSQAELWCSRLSPLFNSADSGIRLGLLQFVAALHPPDLERILVIALEDESGQVRQSAAMLLSEELGARALQPLLRVLLGAGFEQREVEEQATFYQALALAAPDEVFPLLEKTVNRRNWFAPRHWRIQKACALRALGLVPIEKSGPLLMKYRKSRDALLSEASREALALHRRRLEGEGAANGRAA